MAGEKDTQLIGNVLTDHKLFRELRLLAINNPYIHFNFSINNTNQT